MTVIPRCIRVSLIAFTLAFLCEAAVELALFCFLSLPWEGWLAASASLVANPLAICWVLKREKRGYDLLKWIAAFSLVWTVSGAPYLYALGVWAISLIALCVWLRLGAVLMLRRKAARDWIDTDTVRGYL